MKLIQRTIQPTGPADNPDDNLTNKDSCSGVWKRIGDVIVENPVVQDSLQIDERDKILALSALLCMAVLEECDKRTTYIGEILEINNVELQRTLMEVIERGFEQHVDFDGSFKSCCCSELDIEEFGCRIDRKLSTLMGATKKATSSLRHCPSFPEATTTSSPRHRLSCPAATTTTMTATTAAEAVASCQVPCHSLITVRSNNDGTTMVMYGVDAFASRSADELTQENRFSAA